VAGFRLGAIALLDALGFKGIWMRQDQHAVIQRLGRLRRRGLELQGADRKGVLLRDHALHLRTTCVSDTIAISAVLRGANPPRRWLYRALNSVCWVAGFMMEEALGGSPPLLFRGAVAAGELLVSSTFWIGPAVDEAAEWHETADGPFFLATPSALDVSDTHADTYPHHHLDPILMLPYEVPLGDGTAHQTLAFAYFYLGQDWIDTKQDIMAAFGNDPLSPRVLKKRENTARFLEHLDHLRKTGDWHSMLRPLRPPKWEDLSTSERTSVMKYRLDHNIEPAIPESDSDWGR